MADPPSTGHLSQQQAAQDKKPMRRYASMMDVVKLKQKLPSPSSPQSNRSASIASTHQMSTNPVVNRLLHHRTSLRPHDGPRVNYWKKLREEDNAKKLAKVSHIRRKCESY